MGAGDRAWAGRPAHARQGLSAWRGYELYLVSGDELLADPRAGNQLYLDGDFRNGWSDPDGNGVVRHFDRHDAGVRAAG